MSTNFQWNNVTFVTLCVNKCLKDKFFGSRKNIVCRNLGKAGVTAFLAGLSLCIHTPHSKSTLLGPIDLGGRPFLAAILQPEKKCPGKLHRSAKARQGSSSR